MCQKKGIVFQTCKHSSKWTKWCDKEEPCKISARFDWQYIQACCTPKCCERMIEQRKQDIVDWREAAMNAMLVDHNEELYEMALKEAAEAWKRRNSEIKEHENCVRLAVVAYDVTECTPGFAQSIASEASGPQVDHGQDESPWTTLEDPRVRFVD